MANGPSVLCVEGGWSPRLDNTDTVLPLLQLLKSYGAFNNVVHRYVDTKEGLLHVMDKWRQRQYSHLSFGYFGFHGEPGEIVLGRERVNLEDLGKILEGACTGKTIYFGSCSILANHESESKYFLRQTGARTVCGYTKDIDWLSRLRST